MSPITEQVAAAKAWGTDWQRWSEVTPEARGVMLAYYRETMRMETWEHQEQNRKMMLKQMQMKGKRK